VGWQIISSEMFWRLKISIKQHNSIIYAAHLPRAVVLQISR
jgi:hypothetical protein